jgi:hypothetical protein
MQTLNEKGIGYRAQDGGKLHPILCNLHPIPSGYLSDAGLGCGACAGILNSVVQLLHFTFFPRAVSGTTRMLRHLRFGHIIRMFFTGFITRLPWTAALIGECRTELPIGPKEEAV